MIRAWLMFDGCACPWCRELREDKQEPREVEAADQQAQETQG